MDIKIKRNEHYLFNMLIVILSLLLFVRYGLQIDIPRIVLSSIIMFTALIGTDDEILAISMCCIPLHEAVDLYYSIAICAFAYIVKYSKKIKINYTAFLGIGMIVWELLHCFKGSFSIAGFLVSIIPLLFLYFLLNTNVSGIDYGFIVRSMSTMHMVACLMLLLSIIINANYNISVAFSKLQRLGVVSEKEMIIGGAINPNSLGIICVLAITGYLQLRLIGKNKKTDIIVMLVLLVFGALTSSRTFLVCLIIMAFLFIIGQRGSLSQKLKFIILLIIFTIIALISLNMLFPELMEYYIKRFTVKDITTGRDVLMSTYHQYIVDNPKVMFGGIGLNNYVDELTIINRISDNVPHNSIQELIIAWGLPGVLMFIFLGMAIIINSKKYCNKHNLINYIPAIVIIVKSMAGQLLLSPYTMLTLSFAYLSLCQNFESKDKL